MYRIIALCFVVSYAHAQIQIVGECNLALNYVSDLNISKTFGAWNQIKRIPNDIEKGDCSTFTVNGSETDVAFTISEKVNKSMISRKGNILATIVPGIYMLNFTDGLQLPFVVQSTNYTDYTILYSCVQVNNSTKSVWAWQYHRKASLSDSEKLAVDNIAKSHPDLVNATWKVTSHDKAVCGRGVTSATSNLIVLLIMFFSAKALV